VLAILELHDFEPTHMTLVIHIIMWMTSMFNSLFNKEGST